MVVIFEIHPSLSMQTAKTTVDNSAGQYNSIAVDTSGKAHISYSAGYTLKYATGP